MKHYLLTEDETNIILQELQEVKKILETIKGDTAQYEKLYTTNELASILHVTTRTIQNWRDQKLISFVQIGSKVLFKAEDVDDFLMNHHIKRKGGES